MKTSACRKRSLPLFLAVLMVLFSGTGGAASAEQARTDGIRAVVERSPFSSAEKADLLGAADRAVRTGVPADDVEIIISRGGERGVDAKTTRDLLDTAAAVQEQGLPLRPVLNRIEQGLSKGVPADRISAASRKLADKMAEAQPIVNDMIRGGVKAGSGRDREYAVETVGRALEQSVPRDSITVAGERVKERRGSLALFDKAVHTMTSLMESGMPAETASRLVHEAVKKGYSDNDLSRMERGVVEGLKKGKQMDDVVKASESELKGEGKKSGGSRGDRDVRRDEGRDDRSGGSRDSGSDRVRDMDRGGKGKGH